LKSSRTLSSRDRHIAYIETHLADDGKFVGQPYIGLGINTNIDSHVTGHLVVLHVRPGDPAAAAGVKDGDELYSVGGVRVTKTNQDRLPFTARPARKCR
jgi:predicted metalloprotease with PDZ domain